jgi:hypothetical protein
MVIRTKARYRARAWRRVFAWLSARTVRTVTIGPRGELMLGRDSDCRPGSAECVIAISLARWEVRHRCYRVWRIAEEWDGGAVLGDRSIGAGRNFGSSWPRLLPLPTRRWLGSRLIDFYSDNALVA